MGGLFHTPTCLASRSEALALVERAGLPLVVLTPEGDRTLKELPLEGGFALVVGNEKRGVHVSWRRRPERLVSIPMLGVVDSLNVTTSASIVLWEAQRRRP